MAVYHLCRICLTEGTNSEAMQPLFDENDSRCAEIVHQIEECGGIELKAHAEFPKLICDQCLHSLDASYRFRTMCQASENALLDAIVKFELKTEPHEGTNVDTEMSEDNSDILFDLHTEIMEAEEVELDILSNEDDFVAEGFKEPDRIATDFSSQSDPEYVPNPKKKKILKVLSKKKSSSPKKRGRPKLVSYTAPSDISMLRAKSFAASRKQAEVQDQIMCEICGNTYSQRNKLNMHMRRHMAEKPYDCEICAKKFACASEVRRHMRVHTGEKPFTCKFCGRTFADRSTNIKHERIHTKERPFVCTTCGKTFTYSNVLKNHMLTHTGEKPYGCRPCNKTFSRKHQLDQHYATVAHQHAMKSDALINGKFETVESDIIILQAEDCSSHEFLYETNEGSQNSSN